MALITCSECGRDVSQRAASCPQCGNPIGASDVVTVQQTSKRWKSYTIAGAVLMVSAMILSMVSASTADPNDVPWGAIIGTLVFLLGLVIVIAGRIGAWWHHG